MQCKERTKPSALKIMESLKLRTIFSYHEEKQYYQLVKGFEGELKWDSLIEDCLQNAIILKDLLFKVNGTVFQIDTLAIMKEKIILYEVKNYEQEYVMTGDDLINCKTEMEIINPLIQLKRASVLFKQLLNKLTINMVVESYVVFVNPNFTLFQSQPHKNILVRSQLDSHFGQINFASKPLSLEASKIAEKLSNCIHKNSSHQDLPEYSMDLVKKGITCKGCQSFKVSIKGRMCVCRACNFSETAYENARRHIEEFTTLFSTEALTTKIISDWCNQIHSDYRIRTILKRDYGYMKK